jgi:hypothetical protein
MQYLAHCTIRHSYCDGISACRSPRTSDKSPTNSFSVLRSSKWSLPSWMFPFCSRCCFSEVTHPQQYSIATRDTVIQWILKCRLNIHWVTSTETSFLKYISTAKAQCSADQRSMASEMLWVWLKGHLRTNSPCQWFHSQLCCQIVRYFCWTLYNLNVISLWIQF